MCAIMIAALRASLVTWVICGLLYPLAVNGLAQWLLPFEANGSLVHSSDGTLLGSRLIGQQWNGPAWFQGRPSATSDRPYDAAGSGASNLGPTSKALAARLAADRTALEAGQSSLAGKMLPADMLTTSGSGLDPDISPANAFLQVPRVAAARSVPPAQIEALVRRHTIGRDLGLFGEPRVNVLELNLDLARAHAGNAK